MTTDSGDPATRFAFGKNWRSFLNGLDDRRIATAEQSLLEMLQREDLAGQRFLDAGSGSGLFSLAAHRLGADVTSFDFDPASVACTEHLRATYAGDSTRWRVLEASVLDQAFLRDLGEFDVVYAWGVLHHTGHMWRALDNVARSVNRGGLLFIALYNDQGRMSDVWRGVKRRYVLGSPAVRGALLAASGAFLWAPSFARGLRRGRPLEEWRSYDSLRGMSKRHDLVDWVGGYPFEVAEPGAVFQFYRDRGFDLRHLVTRHGLGCNEFVFERTR